MDSVLSTSTTIFLKFPKSNPKTLLKPYYSNFSLSANSSCNCNHTGITASINQNPFPKTLKTAVLSLAAALMASAKFTQFPVKAETLPPIVQQTTTQIDEKDDLEVVKSKAPLSELMESSADFVDNLRGLLHQKLDNGEDEEGLKILEKLVEAQPNEMEWKFLLARLLNEMGKTHESRLVFEDILSVNPLCFEALFENALLMDRSGEAQAAVLSRLERALGFAIDQGKPKEARDVRLIMAQMKFLQKNLDEALSCYDELIKEDPKDFRPYFCKGMIYSLLDRNAEAKQQFAMYKQLSPRKFEVEGYLRSPLSRIKLFDTSGSQNY